MPTAPHILLVDDEIRFTANLAKLLTRQGFIVSKAFNGHDALNELTTKKGIAVVVLDVRMPGMDGIDTLRAIKRMNGSVEVIMLTGQASLDDGIEAVRAGAFDYLQKPYDIEDLIAKVRAACDVERIRRQPVLWPRSQAGEIILSGFVPLHADDRLPRALAVFNRYRDGKGGHMLFIVDRQGSLVGSVTRRDLLDAVAHASTYAPPCWEWLQRHREAVPDASLNSIMNPRVETVAPETPLSETALRMLRHRYDSIPVVEDGRMLGVIRLRDVLAFVDSEPHPPRNSHERVPSSFSQSEDQ